MYCEGKLKFKSHNTSYYLYCPLYKNLRNKYIINEESQSDSDFGLSLRMVSLCNMSFVWCY
jgi:hypothetical protein